MNKGFNFTVPLKFVFR